jgi:hypothetical protein
MPGVIVKHNQQQVLFVLKKLSKIYYRQSVAIKILNKQLIIIKVL